jgi:hypothetical protein
MTDLEELAQVVDLKCYRCGRIGADTLEHPRELEEFLHPAPLTSQPRRLERPVQLRTIRAEDVERIGLPVHRKCRPGWRPPDRSEPRQPPPGYFDRSVA